ncbi:MAG: VanZ family protein [Anaerolineae bacterium]
MVVANIRLRQTAVRWLPLLLWMAIIFAVSDRTPSELPQFGLMDVVLKKGAHFLAYAWLALLAYRALSYGRHRVLWALFIVAAYAVSDEIHQSFVPGRHAMLADVLIDTLGGAAGLYGRLRWAKRPLIRDRG